MKIPKIIHYVWFGKTKKMIYFINAWKVGKNFALIMR